MAREVKKILISTMPRSGTVYLHNLIATCFNFKKVEPPFSKGIHTEPPEWNPYKSDETFMSLRNGEVLCAHYPLNEKIKLLIEDNDVLPLFLYRDPRDVAVSTTLYIKHVLTHHPLHNFIAKLSESDALALILEGGIVPAEGNKDCGYIIYEGMKYFCDEALQWINHPKVAHIRYEDITTDPVKTLTKALYNVNVEIDPELLKDVSTRLSFNTFSNGRAQGNESKTSHFRKGVIGDYKLHFSDFHKSVCKLRFGMELIELQYETSLLW
jgi:hypothetical protein